MKLVDYGQIRLDLQSGQWLIEDQQVKQVEDEFSTSEPCLLISDFGGAPQGVEKVKSNRRYAAAILEKSLRDRGETEGISQVLLLDTHTDSGITQALYHAVSSEDYLDYRKRTRNSRDHLIIGSHLSLLLARARAEKVGNVCVLFQHQNCLDVLVLLNNRAEFCQRFTVSESSAEAWLRTIQFVSEEIKEVAEKVKADLQYAVWADWNPIGPNVSDSICQWIENNTSMQVSRDPVTTLHFGDFVLQSALPGWVRRFHSKHTVFPMPSLVWYWSERLLPAAAVALLAAGISLAAAGYQWQQQIDLIELSNESMISDSDVAVLQSARQAMQQGLPAMPSSDLQQLIQTLSDANSQMSLASVIADVQSSMPDEVRLSSIRLDTAQAYPQLVLDGWIDTTPANVNTSLENFIEQLGAAGYSVRDNGLSAYRQKNYFQLILGMSKGAAHEV